MGDIHILQRRPGPRGRVHIEGNENLRLRTHAVFLVYSNHDSRNDNDGKNRKEERYQ